MSTTAKLLTAEEFWKIADHRQMELECGEVIIMNQPGLRHGYVCTRVISVVDQFVEAHRLGRVFSNDAGVVTERGPDTVRGPDVMYYSFARLPADVLPEGYGNLPPEVAFEVLSPDDRPRRVIRKIAEYLTVGVLCVVVLDPESRTISLHRKDQLTTELSIRDELRLPEISDAFAVPVARLFS